MDSDWVLTGSTLRVTIIVTFQNFMLKKIAACCVVKCLGIFPLFAVISVEAVTQKSSVLHILHRTLLIKVMHHAT